MSDFVEVNRDLTMVDGVTKDNMTVWTATCRQTGCEDWLSAAYSHSVAQQAAAEHQRDKHGHERLRQAVETILLAHEQGLLTDDDRARIAAVLAKSGA